MWKALFFKLGLVTVTAVAAAFYAMASIQIGGLEPHSYLAAQIIRERFPVHLVNPATIHSHDQADILFRWKVAEIRARVGIVSLGWLLTASVLTWQHLHRRKSEQFH